jgi:uncharacterized protein (DUF1778 family)
MATTTHPTRTEQSGSKSEHRDDAAAAPGSTRSSTRTRRPRKERLEARVDSETNAIIARAAAVLNLSKSEFVVTAVAAEAQRVVARTDVTIMPAEMFDQMMSSLEVPDEGSVETLRASMRGVPTLTRRR